MNEPIAIFSIRKLKVELMLLNEGNLEQLKKDFKKTKNNNIDDPHPTQEPKKSSRASSPSRKATEEELSGEPTPPPKFTGFDSSELNDIVNKLNENLQSD
ncbi:14304_t:CDS:2, partial [Funneliformis geosporum]